MKKTMLLYMSAKAKLAETVDGVVLKWLKRRPC